MSMAGFCSALLSCSQWYRQELLLTLVGMVYFSLYAMACFECRIPTLLV